MNRLDLSRWLIHHTPGLPGPLALSMLARIANQLLGVALLVLAADALATAASGAPVSVWALVVWMAGLALAKALLRYLEHYAGHWVAFTALQRLRELFFARLVPQAPAATTGRAGAELTERATRDIDRIEVFFAHTFPPAVAAVIVPSVALAWLGIAVNPSMALAVAPFLIVIVVVLPGVANGATWRSARRIARIRGELAEHVGDDIQGVREVLAFGAQDARLDGLERIDRALGGERSRTGLIQAARTVTAVTLQAGALIAPVLVAVTQGIGAHDLAVALAVAVGLIVPSRGIDDFATGLDSAFAATDRVRRIVDARPLVPDTGTGELPGADAALSFEDVTLRYDDAGHPALDGVSLRIPPGAWSYLVGVSGGGKSSLATLLLRGRDPDAGRIAYGDVDLRELPLDRLRTEIALVSQRPTMMTGTIADNLRLAAPEAGDDELRSALHVVALDAWSDGLERGLGTPVGERGATVSGGQLQRLALARALVARPGIVVLDEALSQLDADTARLVRRRLAESHPSTTVIEITHRVDLVPDDAQVLVIDGGRLVETGPARRLRARNGPFSRLLARN
jgi:ABC-type multidrug transport system fused ATPase/permease subunit